MIKKIFMFVLMFSSINAKYSWYLNDKLNDAKNEIVSGNKTKSKLETNTFLLNQKSNNSYFILDGKHLLNLIEILEKIETRESIMALSKIHKLYYLEFYKLISRLKADESEIIFASTELSDLFLPNIKDPDLKTFKIRNILTKMFIQMCIINKTIGLHQTKKDAIHFLLDSARQEILSEKMNIDKKELGLFFKILEIHVPKALLGKWTKRLLISSSIVLAIAIVCVIIQYNYDLTKLRDLFINQITTDLKKIIVKSTNEALNAVEKRNVTIFGKKITMDPDPNKTEFTIDQHRKNPDRAWYNPFRLYYGKER